MNFAAQLFYSSYLSERLERLYSPRPALKDSEENDPFWQRWEITPCSPLVPRDLSPTQLSTIVTDLPSAQSSEVAPASTVSLPLPLVYSIPPPHPLCLQPTLTSARSNHKRSSTKPTTCLPSPCFAVEVPQSRVLQTPLHQSSFSSVVYTKESPAPSSFPTEMASSSSISPSSSSFSPLAPTPCRDDFLHTFQTLVDLLLRLVIYFILLLVSR